VNTAARAIDNHGKIMFHSAAAVILFVTGLFAGMLLMLEMGRRIGVRRRLRDPDGAAAGLGALDGAVFGLMALLIAFTFSAAASRFDKRRELIVQEANDIGTAYLRLDLLPASAQPALKDCFRRYVNSRLAVYQALPDVEAAKAKLAESNLIQAEIWTRAVAATKIAEVNGNAVTSLVLSSLNEMIDITTTRTVALQTHLPTIIFVMLSVLVLGGSLISGYGMAGGKGRSLLHVLSYAVLMAGVIYIILDLEHPHLGLIRIEVVEQLLAKVGESMK
jgi:hypothetical protein